MTLITMVQAIADETKGPRISTVVGSTNPDAQNYLRIMQKVGHKMMKTYPWNDLKKEHTFTSDGTETLVASANMPSDFDRFIPETFWDRSGNNLLSGPIQQKEWAERKAYNPSIENYKWIYRGGDILINPVLGTNSSCAFDYVSNEFVLATDGTTYKTSFTADSDTSVIEEELLIRAGKLQWLIDEGLPYQMAFQEFKDYFDILQENEDATDNIAVTADIFATNSRHTDGIPAASQTSYYGTY